MVGLLRECKVLFDVDIALRGFYSLSTVVPFGFLLQTSISDFLNGAFSMIKSHIPDFDILLCYRHLVESICLFFKVVKTHILILSFTP